MLALFKDLVERQQTLLYAVKSVAADLTGGKHFPEMFDGSDQEALLALCLSAIAIAERPFQVVPAAEAA